MSKRARRRAPPIRCEVTNRAVPVRSRPIAGMKRFRRWTWEMAAASDPVDREPSRTAAQLLAEVYFAIDRSQKAHESTKKTFDPVCERDGERA